MRTAIARAFFFSVLGIGAACGPKEAADEHGHHAEGTEPASRTASSEPSVPLDGLRGISIVVAPEPRAEGAWFPAEAIGDEAARAVLSAPVSGIVSNAPFPPGVPVRRGAELLVLNSPEKADLLSRWIEAQAEWERAEANLRREESLLPGGATSAREVEEAAAQAASARAGREAARLGLEARGISTEDRSGRTVVRAPSNGSVLSWSVRLGESVEAGRPLGEFQAAAARLVLVELPLPGPTWSIGDTTEVRSSDGARWSARVVGLPAALGEETRRLGYRLALESEPYPLPGRPVEVRVPFASGVILPQSALQQIEGVWGVFVREGGRAVFRPVRRAMELGSDVLLQEGIEPGQEVVTDGAYLLKSTWLKLESGGDAHEH